jgi:hypothetical protein
MKRPTAGGKAGLPEPPAPNGLKTYAVRSPMTSM